MTRPRMLGLASRFSLLLSVALLALFASVPGCRNYDVLVRKDQVTQQKFADLQAQL